MSDISHSWMVKYEMPASDVNWYGLCIHSRHFGTIAIFYKTKTPIGYQEYISRGVIKRSKSVGWFKYAVQSLLV